MAIYVSGSLAYDRIMTFPGNFQDHILMDKLHMINVSFMVDRMEEKRGGCAGNIAYALALLGEKPHILSSVGRDFDSYARHLEGLGLPLDGLRRDEELFTALCYITTDLKSNQITGFYPGAMSLPCGYTFPDLNPAEDIAIVSPGNMDDMRSLPRFYREHGVRYIFDPGQQLPVFTGEELLDAITGSYAVITNDYELSMVCKATGKTRADIASRTEWLITTLGEHGCQLAGKVNQTFPAVPCRGVVDPTGAGDAHRGGLLKGLVCGMDMPDAVCMGATAASFAIEQYGTQEYTYDAAGFKARYEAAYGTLFLNW
ncbi:MAG: carbohydrate kinase family protein [Desulfovibrionaceae bacterium]|nr:carbohydrate kinase family protein [Desulfovibrionaceae bacterium]